MLEFFTGITIASPVLNGILTVAEILITGFILYFVWEGVLKVFGRPSKNTVERN